MLNADPAVHGDGAELNLQPDRMLRRFLQKAQRQGEDHVIVAVSIGFWIADVVLFPQNLNTQDLADEADHLINILDKGTDQTNPCCIPYVLKGTAHRHRETLPLQLCFHISGALDPILEGSDWVAPAIADLIPADHVDAGKKFLNRPSKTIRKLP